MTAESPSPEPLRPSWYPFVMRPVLLAAIPAGMLAAASFFFREPLSAWLGRWTMAVPLLAALPLVVLFVERCIRYGKTRYTVRPDRIVIETGTLFRERSVELDVENITLVEWNSPFLLRTFYDVGHVTAQEAGSAARPAQMSYIDAPGRVYQTVAEHMRSRGFSMRRDRRIQEERPGHLGALVDLTIEQIAFVWATGLFLVSFLPEMWPLIVGEGPTLMKLVAGDYTAFSDLLSPGAFVRARIGLVVLGGIAALLTGGHLAARYVDLVHRTYTLYDDTIDYVDGFLNETHKFIPLENLADTQLARPFYKRILGLSDVTLSSQGADNAIAFRSTPNGPSFAEAIDDLLHRDPARPDPSEAPETATASPRAEDGDSGDRGVALRPQLLRAALGAIDTSVVMIPFALTLLAPLLLQEAGETLEYGPVVIATLAGGVMVATTFVAAVGVLSGLWGLVRARATEFRLDERGAQSTVDLFSRTDRQFALERITSVSVRRNPLDWLAGTMTLRFRSVGSQEDLDFWGIPHDPELIDALRRRLGLGGGFAGESNGRLTPEYDLLDGLKARGPIYLICAALLAVPIPTLAWFEVSFDFRLPVALLGIAATAVVVHQAARAIVHGRIGGALFDDRLEITGGIVRRYRHIAPLEHVKAVESRRYPGSHAGRLTFRTAGFPITAGHLPDIAGLHEAIDRRLAIDGDGDAGKPTDAEARPVAVAPSAGTEMLRYSVLLIVGLGLVVMPYVFVYYRRVDYTVEPGRLIADSGLYFARRTTILFDRVDHIEANRRFVHHLTDTGDIEVYTVGSRERDLVLRSLAQSADTLALVRRRLGTDTSS